MKRRILIGLAIAVAVIAFGVLIFRLAIPPSVPVAEAEMRAIVETLVVTGQIEPEGRTVLTAQVAATVTSVEVERGDQVEEDALLLTLDDEEGRLAVEQAEAGVAEARARLDSVVDQGAPTALQDLNQAQQNLEAAEQELQRARQLHEAGVGTRAEVDDRQRQVQNARADVERARAAYREATVDGSAYDEAAAMVERAEAERELARHQLRRYTIRAPDDVTVLTRQVESGTSVQPGEPLIAIAPEGPLDIRITPDERELANLEVGQPVLAITDAYPHRPFEAEVYRIDPSIDAERGAITAYLRIEDPPEYLRADMTTTADIELGRRDDALVVPRVAVRNLTGEQPWVLTFHDNRTRRVDVDIGLQDDHFVEIVDGLDEGDLVVADPEAAPGERLRQGEFFEPDDDDHEPDPAPDTGFPEPPRAQVELPTDEQSHRWITASPPAHVNLQYDHYLPKAREAYL